MKPVLLIIFISLFSLTALNVYSQTSGSASSSTPLIYMASTPCSSGTKPLPGIPPNAGCELMLWELKLYGNNEKQTGGTYILDCDYGLPQQGTKGLIHGGTLLHREGKWIVIKGTTTDPLATIYRLDPDQPEASVSFIRLNENLLHLLDSDQHLMIGTGGWSYTLSKVK